MGIAHGGMCAVAHSRTLQLPPRVRVCAQVNSDILARIRAAFDKADKDGTGQLEQPEFVSAFVGACQAWPPQASTLLQPRACM